MFDFVIRRKYQSQSDTANTILKIPVSNSFYGFLKDIPLNDQSLLVPDDFEMFLNRFEFNGHMFIYPERVESTTITKSFSAYLTENNIQLLPDEQKMLTVYLNQDKKSKSSQKNAVYTFNLKQLAIIDDYQKKHVRELNKEQIEEKALENGLEACRRKDSVLINVFGVEKNLVYDILKAKSLSFTLKSDIIPGRVKGRYTSNVISGIDTHSYAALPKKPHQPFPPGYRTTCH